MSRIDPARFRTRPTHEDTQIALLQVLTKLVITVQHKEPIISVLAAESRRVINNAIPNLQSCLGKAYAFFTYWDGKERPTNHPELIKWLKELEKILADDPNAITLERLEIGRRLVTALDDCRTPFLFY